MGYSPILQVDERILFSRIRKRLFIFSPAGTRDEKAAGFLVAPKSGAIFFSLSLAF
jgi:hypothetical protein